MDNILKSTQVIYAVKQKDRVHIRTDNDFFSDPVIVRKEPGIMSFTKPTLDYRGKTYKFSKNSTYKYQAAISGIEMETGFYVIDEDSTEDEILIYLDLKED